MTGPVRPFQVEAFAIKRKRLGPGEGQAGMVEAERRKTLI